MGARDTKVAVVLAAGRGSRMQKPAAHAALNDAQAAAAAAGMKGMIPDNAGRPFLDHVLSSLADAGVDEICLVVGPGHGDVRAHYAEHPPRRVQLAFEVQRDPRGTADAMLTVEPWTNGRDFLVLNADNLYPVEALRALATLGGCGLIAFDRAALIRGSNIDAGRIAAFAVVTLDADDSLLEIVEKPTADVVSKLPDAETSNWISMNLWRFDATIFDACREVPISPRGEFELPLAVQLAISRGSRFRAIRMEASVLDLSNRDDIAAVAQRLGDEPAEP